VEQRCRSGDVKGREERMREIWRSSRDSRSIANVPYTSRTQASAGDMSNHQGGKPPENERAKIRVAS